MSDLSFDVGLAYKLKKAFASAGWSESDINSLAESKELGQLKQIFRGHASIIVVEHAIDCDADPFNRWEKDGWTVEEHQKGGTFKWDASRVELYLASGQKNGKVIEGNKLRKELAKKPVLNANVLDYLLKNPHLIPKEWKRDGQGNTRYIFFWGTIYRRRGGDLYVRCLCWSDGRWRWGYDWLGFDFRGRRPAAVRAS